MLGGRRARGACRRGRGGLREPDRFADGVSLEIY
jgi:hypothetical protein